jgi:hypothetical protein
MDVGKRLTNDRNRKMEDEKGKWIQVCIEDDGRRGRIEGLKGKGGMKVVKDGSVHVGRTQGYTCWSQNSTRLFHSSDYGTA